MCGITGILNMDKNMQVDLALLRNMNNTLIHRGPDHEGYFTYKNIGFGHKRLEIIDLDSGSQPMYSSDKNIIIVFNGEIYNYLELKKILILKGLKFNTNSDTEIIINSYLEWGIDCQKKFNGI